MITTIFFDLDGTLLPMNQEAFVEAYLHSMTTRMARHGYAPDKLAKSIWTSTGAMIQNRSCDLNESVFWKTCSAVYGQNVRLDEAIFQDYYINEFQSVKNICGFDPRAAQTIDSLKKQGYRLVLATNPLFPSIATYSRICWAGLTPDMFEWITTYENASRCKPNPDYYREILDKLKLSADECLMVGNDAEEDMIAASLGMKVFLLTDCLINRHNQDISQYPNGSFPDLLHYIRSL